MIFKENSGYSIIRDVFLHIDTTYCKVSPFFNNRFRIECNRYLKNGKMFSETSITFVWFVYIVKFVFGISSYRTGNSLPLLSRRITARYYKCV